ncbi:MAG: site-2 protease family protein [Candidatus Ratteibacteria bacterium]|nr:site-2 protease family protein [Candidatus Ratteibacteria bacterium]
MLLVYVAQILAFTIAITVHEASHGWLADKLGDKTARAMGRVTMNPLAHIDPIGTVVLPLLLILTRSPFIFGWAKPVPVNPYNLRNPRKDMLWIGLAGPTANIITAVVFALILRSGMIVAGSISQIFVVQVILINLVLAVFNLIPIPPLDGYQILSGLLPREAAISYSRIQPYGMWILIALLVLGVIGAIIGSVVGILFRILVG